MRLKRLRLVNVCQFRELEYEFNPGLTGVIGPNGSGKSNLIKSILFALVGVFRNAGLKADNVAQLGEGEESYARLDFEHHGLEATVCRYLAGGRTYFTDGGEPIHGDQAATAAVVERLGIDAKALGEYVFIPQLHLTDFIDAAPGDRARVFARLFGTDAFEAVNTLVTAKLAGELVVAPPSPEIEPTRARIAARERRMAEVLSRLEELGGQRRDLAADEAKARAVLAGAARAQAIKEELVQLTAAEDDAQRAIHTVGAEHFMSRLYLETLEVKLPVATEEANRARVALATWRTAEARRRRAEVLAERRRRLQDEAAAHRPPDGPPDAPTDEEAAFWNGDGRLRKMRLDDMVALIDGGSAHCPLCQQSVAPLHGRRAELVAERDALTVQLARVEEKVARQQAYLEALGRWERWRAQSDWARAELDTDELALAAEQEAHPEVDPAELQKVVDLADEAAAACAQLRERIAAAAATMARHQGRRDQVHAQMKALNDEWDAVRPLAETVALAEAMVCDLEELRREEGRAEGEADELLRAAADDEALLARLEAAEAAMAARRVLRAGAELVAAVTHRQAAPRLIAEAKLDRLVDDVDEYLGLFGVDFLVRLGEGLAFVADFADGRSQAAGRLSDGQKSVLALAFWVAVNSLFAGQLGFLCLDEPTASLDQQNLGALRLALGELRSLSASLGLQCLLVTHEQALAPLFDAVLPLTHPR